MSGSDRRGGHADEVPVQVIRSARRTRTVGARLVDGRLVVRIPARFTAAQEALWVERMRERVAQPRSRRPAPAGDAGLERRASELSRRFLGGRAVPASVRWVDNQHTRWGSCTPDTGAIRISSAVRDMPDWVIDYVLLHELAHLIEGGHGPRFWALLESYPRTERARGYLEGVVDAARLDLRD